MNVIIGRKDNAEAWRYLVTDGEDATWTLDRNKAKRYADRGEAMKVRARLRARLLAHIWLLDEPNERTVKMDLTFNVTVTIEIDPETTHSEMVETAAPLASEKLRLYPMDCFELCEPTPC